MTFFNINRNEQQELISQLEQALYNHHQWHNALLRTLICQLAPDQHDVQPEAHKHCRFGQWYYNFSSEKLHEHPGFVALGEVHQRMHELAKSLLTSDRITIHDYDLFANVLEQMLLETRTLKRELEDSLYHHDPLTGAVNRVNMLPILREQQELTKRKNQTCCIAILDLDNFKDVNTQYGHQAGDQVLVETIRQVMKSVRPYDKVFRYGGEEFILCMQQTDLAQAYEMIEHLRQSIASNRISYKDAVIQITASFGITVLDPYSLVEDSIERADKALYLAKSAGKNCTKIWEAEGS